MDNEQDIFADQAPDYQVRYKFNELLHALKTLKPNDRSETDRYWAITITDVEKARAVFKTYVTKE